MFMFHEPTVGLEPTTSALQRRHSGQVSYAGKAECEMIGCPHTDYMSEAVPIITAITTGIVAIIAAYGAFQARKVHTIVNSRTDAMVARIDQLVEELHVRGDGSVPNVPEKE